MLWGRSVHLRMSKVLLVDGSNIMMRGVKAAEVNRRWDSVADGAAFLFITQLSKYVRQVDPDRMLVAWDGGRSKYRMSLYPEYKEDRIDRVEASEEERTPFNMAKEFLTLAGIHHIERDRVEADDIVAVAWHKHFWDDVVILSGDKDFLQLVGPNPGGYGETIQIRPHGNPEVWTQETVWEKMGCDPIDIPDVMALTGDKGDGVPGIYGYGIKTAVKHLKKYGSLEALLASDEKKVQGQRDIALLSRRLVRLRGLDYEPGVEVVRAPKFRPTSPGGISWDALIAWLDRYRFQSIKERLIDGSLWKV